MARSCPSCRRGVPDMRWTCPACGWSASRRRGLVCLAPEHEAREPGFDPADFSRLAALEPRSFWFRARNRILVEVARGLFPGTTALLEVGCGTGFVLAALSEALPEVRLVGSELYLDGLDLARARLGGAAELQQMDARAMPYDREFDLIGAFDVLEHIEEDEQVLAEMFRTCTPGGGLLLTVPQHAFLWGQADEYAHHKRRYSRRDLLEKVRAAGFEVVRATSFVTLLFPMLVASRISEQLRGGDFDPDRELALPGWLDRVLDLVMRAEHGLIRLGLDLPFGGSLLVAARRPQSEKGSSP